MGTNYEAPHYELFFSPPLRRLRPKYPPQHHIVEHPRPMSLPQRERPICKQ